MGFIKVPLLTELPLCYFKKSADWYFRKIFSFFNYSLRKLKFPSILSTVRCKEKSYLFHSQIAAALQLLNLFHVRSGENKCRLRRRLFSFLFSQIAAASRHPLLRSFSICFMYARVKTNVAFGAACFPSSFHRLLPLRVTRCFAASQSVSCTLG